MSVRRPRPARRHVLGCAALLFVAAAGCDDSSGPQPPPHPGLAECGASNVFRPRNFGHSTRIDNPFLTLTPGMQYIMDGVADRGGGVLPHRVVFTVTDLTKVIDGVRSVVMWDRDYNNEVLSEAELAFFAQDDEGNIWTMGEYPEEYENGEFVGAPSTWISGLGGAVAGILIPGPKPLGYPFMQGWAPIAGFLDCATVYQTGQSACSPYGCYENVLVIDEWSPLEVGSGHQRKYYAVDVGVVKIGAVDDPEGETLVLTSRIQLTPALLAEARAAALKLEARAYQVSDVYCWTQPAE